MYKAFLSHSSLDKEIVRTIKNLLQRVWTYFDEDCFEVGEDFRNAITQRIEDTRLFVLFASKNSLASSWVKFELDEAFWEQIKRNGIQFVVLTLDDISPNDLPKWMRKAKFERVSSPMIASQQIRKMLFDDNSFSRKIFIGRENDSKEFYEDIKNMQPTFPSIIALVGLDGIGRRAFAEDVFSKRFSLDYKSEFLLNEAEGILELYYKLIDDSMTKFSPQELSESLALFMGLKKPEQIFEICRLLAIYTRNKAYPIIKDNGALLDEKGRYKEDFLNLLRCFSANYPDHYLLIIHNRMPQLDHSDRSLIYRRRLQALDPTSCYAMFDSLLKRNNVKVSNQNQVQDISRYLDGYPPAIIFAATECKLEGIDIVSNDKITLMDFQSGIFSKYLCALPLEETEKLILELLHNVGDMTITIISSLSHKTPDEVSVALKRCVDFSIVDERNNGMYGIAAPINIAVSRNFTRYQNKQFGEIARNLKRNFWDNNELPNMDTVNILISALLKANLDDELKNFQQFILPSTLLKAAKDANQNQEWSQAEKYSKRALELDNSLNDARCLLFKVLVRQENQSNREHINSQENELIDELRTRYDKRVFYLEGFREWKRSHFFEAIDKYELAKVAGDDSIQLHRDLAECLYQVDRISDAYKEINIVMDSPRKINNPFILDLATKIAINAQDYDRAESLLARQQIVDKPENVDHRKATMHLKKGEFEDAMVYATKACNGKHPLPQMNFLKMNIAIHLEQYDVVEDEYKYIKDHYRWYNPDICEILYTHMLLKKYGWKIAEASFSKLQSKSTPIALNLRYRILEMKMADRMISIIDKRKAEEEISRISTSRLRDLLSQIRFYDGHDDNSDND